MSDSIEIHRLTCTVWKCKRARFQGSRECLEHLVLNALLESQVIEALNRLRGNGPALTRKLRLREHYLSFFRARAQALANGSVRPVSSPIEAIAVALTIHPHTRLVQGRLFTIDDWAALMRSVETIDHRVMMALRRLRDRKRVDRDQALRTG